MHMGTSTGSGAYRMRTCTTCQREHDGAHVAECDRCYGYRHRTGQERPRWLKCHGCGAWYEWDANRVYCSDRCRETYATARWAEKHPATRAKHNRRSKGTCTHCKTSNANIYSKKSGLCVPCHNYQTKHGKLPPLTRKCVACGRRFRLATGGRRDRQVCSPECALTRDSRRSLRYYHQRKDPTTAKTKASLHGYMQARRERLKRSKP